MSAKSLVWICCTTLFLVGCSDSSRPSAADGGSDGRLVDGPSPDNGWPAKDCIVAWKMDLCCPEPVAVPAAQAEAEPCLMPAPMADEVPQECLPTACPEVPCPPERFVVRTAGVVNGSCTFVDECASEADCVVATDAYQCCSCPQAFPTALVERAPCVVGANEDPPDGCLPPGCTPNPCGACRVPDGVSCEVNATGFSVCETVWSN